MTQRLFPAVDERDEPGPFESTGIVRFCHACGGSGVVYCCEGERAQSGEPARPMEAKP